MIALAPFPPSPPAPAHINWIYFCVWERFIVRKWIAVQRTTEIVTEYAAFIMPIWCHPLRENEKTIAYSQRYFPTHIRICQFNVCQVRCRADFFPSMAAIGVPLFLSAYLLLKWPKLIQNKCQWSTWMPLYKSKSMKWKGADRRRRRHGRCEILTT